MLAKVDESAYLLAKEKYDWSEIGKQTISFIRQLVEGGN
jgi:ABC-type iron transport system FetAB ATPase subunit